jgi:hypothetical protein
VEGEADYHFVAFISDANGNLLELDGTKSGPLGDKALIEVSFQLLDFQFLMLYLYFTHVYSKGCWC